MRIPSAVITKPLRRGGYFWTTTSSCRRCFFATSYTTSRAATTLVLGGRASSPTNDAACRFWAFALGGVAVLGIVKNTVALTEVRDDEAVDVASSLIEENKDEKEKKIDVTKVDVSKKPPPAPNATADPEKELLHKKRTLLLTGTIDDKVARAIVAQLLFLDAADSSAPIRLVINCNGGGVTDGFAIYDTMKFINAPVHTLALGQASSFAVLLLAAGAKGHRIALPSTRVMIHSASSAIAKQQVEDVVLRAEELQAKNEMILRALATDTGSDLEVLRPLLGRDLFFGAERAKELGIIDAVVSKAPSMAKSGEKAKL